MSVMLKEVMIMTNTNLLKSKMIANGDENFVGTLSNFLACSRTTASKKLNGELQFSQGEIAILADKYKLSADEIKQIFIGVD